MITSNNIQTSFPNNKHPINLASKRDYMLYVYGNPKVQYYNDPKKEENKKFKIISSIAMVAISTGAILLNTISSKGKITPNLKILKNIHLPENKLKNLKLSDKFTNLTCNFTNIKDDLWDRFAKKTKNTPLGFIDKIGQKATKLYKKWAFNSSIAQKYNNAYKELLEKYPEAIKLQHVEDFQSAYNKINSDINEVLHQKNNRITQNLFFKKGFINKITNETLADTKINKLESVKDAFQKIEIPDDISPKAREALENFNEIKLKTAEELIPKLRDINTGNAPTDLITILASTATLMGAVALEDDKKEKKSILINLGIPLITTFATQIYGTIKLLSGTKALIFGLATGQIASQIANLINITLEHFTEKKDTKNTQS